MKKLLLILFLFINSLSFSQTFKWAVDADGGNIAAAFSVATDASNNVYVTGYYDGTVDFDPGAGNAYLTDNGGVDVFVLKLNSDGDFQWVKSMGGFGNDRAYAITIDADGNIYSAGEFYSTVDFDPGAEEFLLSASGGSNPDFYIQKLDTDGNFIWAKRVGNSSAEQIYNLTVDNSGNVISTGGFRGTVDFDPGASVAHLSSGINSDLFVLKLSSNGDYLWAINGGGSDFCLGVGVGTDDSENVYVTGAFEGVVDVDPSIDGVFDIVSFGDSEDAFLLKLNSDGEFVWAKDYGFSGTDFGSALTVSDLNNVYVSGVFRHTVDFDPNEGISEISSEGQTDIFLQKFDTDGNLIWVRSVGTSLDEDAGYKIAVDSDENSTIISYVNYGSLKMTVTSFASSGYKRWFVEIDNIQYGFCITNDTEGFVYPTGVFTGSHDFNPFGGTTILSTSSSDYYLLKLGSEPNGIDELNISKSLRVYPNPSNGKFKIELPENAAMEQIKILNTAGKIVFENTKNINNTEIDITLQPGVYFVQLTLSSGEILTEKIIVT